LPESLTKIGSNFLYDGSGNIVFEVTLLSQTPPTIEKYSFRGKTVNFYVPKGTLSAYQTAWTDILSSSSTFTIQELSE